MYNQDKPIPPIGSQTRFIQSKIDVAFLGWQESMAGELFPLYNIVKIGHPSYQSTVGEKILQALHLRIPRTPSPYPDVAPSPWHTLGTSLNSPATSREAIIEAGLNYTVEKKPLKDVLRPNTPVNVTDRWATVRTDTGDVLGVVGDEYKPIQNVDAFEFFDDLVAKDQAIYETAGILGHGERIWILAKLPGYIKVNGNDLVSKYLLLSNSHDGSSLVQMKLTPIRVVCNNTLSASLKGTGEVNIRNAVNAAEDAEQAQSLLHMAQTLYAKLEATFNSMALTRITEKQLHDYVNALIPDNGDADKAKNQTIRDSCLKLYESGHGAKLSRGTLWGAFNCVTEFTDHAMEDNTANRLESIWSGHGERLNRKAFQLAEQMMQ